MARPRKQLDPRRIEELSRLGCTQQEIGELVGCSPDTLQRRYGHCLRKGWAERNLSLRRLQFRAARAGNIGMQIWLGRNSLHQTDQPKPEHATDRLHELLKLFDHRYEEIKNGDDADDRE